VVLLAEKMLSFSCVYCNALNELEAKVVIAVLAARHNVPIICGHCARLQNGQEIVKSDKQKDDFLKCIPYEAEAADVPAGPGENVAGVTKWTDAKGDKFTRAAFILQYGLDPLVYWINKNRLDQAFGHELMIGQPPTVKLGKT
jgi:hypothetical protein